jgi:2,4'-dihydroxyacetophenone dioxygenase
MSFRTACQRAGLTRSLGKPAVSAPFRSIVTKSTASQIQSPPAKLSGISSEPRKPLTLAEAVAARNNARKLTTTASQRVSQHGLGFIRPKADAIPYTGPPLHGVAEDLIVNEALNLKEDEKYWVPQLDNVAFRPLLFSLAQGYWVLLLRVRQSGILSRHRHTGPVHAATLKGKWHYLEHDWWATPGTYSYEPPGDIHTLEVPEGVEEMVTLFHVTGSYTYVEPDGTPIAAEDVFSQDETARDHYMQNGVGEEYLKTLVR